MIDTAKVFISYAHDDLALVDFCEAGLQASSAKIPQSSIEIYYDRKMLDGERWADWIDKQIEEADAVLVLLTHNSLLSPHVIYEASYAIGAQVPVFLLQFGNVELSKLSFKLDQLQIKRYEDSREEIWGDLIRAIRDLPGRSAKLRKKVRSLFRDLDIKCNKIQSNPALDIGSPEELIRQVALDAAVRASDSVIYHQSLFLKSTISAYTMMSILWNRLYDYLQGKHYIKPRDGGKLIALALHGQPYSFWSTPDAREALSSQKRFIESGGKVCRILVLDPKKKSDSSIENEKSSMREHRIDVFEIHDHGDSLKYSGELWIPDLRLYGNYGTRYDGSFGPYLRLVDEDGFADELHERFSSYIKKAKDQNGKAPEDYGYKIDEGLKSE